MQEIGFLEAKVAFYQGSRREMERENMSTVSLWSSTRSTNTTFTAIRSKFEKKKNLQQISLKGTLEKYLYLYSECSQTHKRASTALGVDIFILLEPSDSCLRSHFILHTATKKEGENWINQIWRGWEGMGLCVGGAAAGRWPIYPPVLQWIRKDG